MLLGNRLRFAIECEINVAESSEVGMRGGLCLYFGGVMLGDIEDMLLLDDALLILQHARPIHRDVGSEFEGKTSIESLDILYTAELGPSHKRGQYLLCPDLGAAFDGIYATRVVYGDHDELIWRFFEEIIAHVMSLAPNEFDDVVNHFQLWLEAESSKIRAEKSNPA